MIQNLYFVANSIFCNRNGQDSEVCYRLPCAVAVL